MNGDEKTMATRVTYSVGVDPDPSPTVIKTGSDREKNGSGSDHG